MKEKPINWTELSSSWDTLSEKWLKLNYLIIPAGICVTFLIIMSIKESNFLAFGGWGATLVLVIMTYRDNIFHARMAKREAIMARARTLKGEKLFWNRRKRKK